MSLKKWFYNNYFYLEEGVKFKYKYGNSIMRGTSELIRIFTINSGLMEVKLSERIFERPWAFANIPNRPLRILDLGCGDGAFPLELKSLGHEVWGSDVKNYLFRDKIKFIKGDILKNAKAFPREFDIVTCVSTIEHFGCEYSLGETMRHFDQNRKDIEGVKLCRSLMKNGGLFILTCPYADKRNLDHLYRIYDEIEIKKLMQGFKMIKSKVINSVNDITDIKVLHPKIFMGVFKKI